MILQPNLLSDLAALQRRDWQREAEMWRLAREARQNRARFLGRLPHRLLAAIKEYLRLQARPNPVTPDLADLRR